MVICKNAKYSGTVDVDFIIIANTRRVKQKRPIAFLEIQYFSQIALAMFFLC
jgi:hypothetical protein